MEWYWLSLGAAVCVVGGVLFGTIVVKKRNIHNTLRFEMDESKEELCEDNGATILKRLRESNWNLEIQEFLNGLDFDHLSEAQLRAFVSEQWIVIKKNILSLEIICNRFHEGKDVVVLFKELLEKNKAALEHLRPFANEVLKIDFKEHLVCAEAQTYPHCLSFMANHGSCTELLCALIVNIPVRSVVFERLRHGVTKEPGWRKEQVAFIYHLESPIVDFDELAIKALDMELHLNGSSWWKMESSAKILQESEKMFWESIMGEVGEPALFNMNEPRESYWEGMNLPVRPALSGVLCNAPFDFGILKKGKIAQSSNTELGVLVEKKRQRTFSEPFIPGTVVLKRKVSTMSDVQVDTEIQEITKQLESLSTNFNLTQDKIEENSCSIEAVVSREKSQSVEFLERVPARESDTVKAEDNKSNGYVLTVADSNNVDKNIGEQ